MALLPLAVFLWSHSLVADEPLSSIDPTTFLAAYRPALQTLEERYANFTCRVTHKRPMYDATVEYAVDGSSFLSVQNYDVQIEKRPAAYPRIHLRSESPDGSFELSRESAADDFFISGLSTSNREILTRYHRRYNKPIALAATHIFDVSMSTLINSKDATIRRVSASAGQGRDPVTVEFQLDPAVFRFHGASVSLQPSHDYQVVSYQQFYSADPSDTTKIAIYSADIDDQNDPETGVEVPSKVVIRVDDGMESTVVEAAIVENYHFSNVTEDRFLISAFGILTTTATFSDVPRKFDFDVSRVSLTVTAGQQVDALIPVSREATADRIIGAECAIVCSRTGCGKFSDLPLAVPPLISSIVTYRFLAQSPGTETIRLTLITDSLGGRRIPVELQVTVTDPRSR